MKISAALAILAAALTSPELFAAPAASVASPKPTPVAWVSHVTMTANGGFLVGNPSARAKLVEYGSLSCPYCRRFHEEAMNPLRARIATGAVSFEFRPFGVHSADPILHALLLCAGPARFNKFSDDFFKDQVSLASVYEMWADANRTVNPSVGAADRIRFSNQWGFTVFAMAHGMTRARVVACLSNDAAIALQEQREDQAANALDVQSTPAFFLNDKPIAPGTWLEINQAIAIALN